MYCYNKRIALAIVIFSIVFILKADEKNSLNINFFADPALPCVNLIEKRNPGFENKLKYWSMSKKVKEAKSVELSDTSYKGKHAIFLKNKKASTYQILSNKMKGVMKPKEKYVLVCYVKADKDVSQRGGQDLGCGASLVFYDKGWKNASGITAKTGFTYDKWKKVISKPIVFPENAAIIMLTAGISYTKGSGIVDEIAIYPASTKLHLDISSKTRLKQIIVENENGKIIFDSGPLSKVTTKFSKEIVVSTACSYILKILDKDNNIKEFKYPESGQLAAPSKVEK